ncbi:mitochondrial import receptor subunit TOM7 homolog [Gopherus flavomarginatus]|uniref:mitochondrial import receptor subunit TOM7 homolog n=1 Tax=Gopherus flavomarginatus TaxID=286002 RepID=UPI0021CBC5C7|nr:mitochondrial import receptor subunit TOM7 homolog [Gopherus flavomarginatus]
MPKLSKEAKQRLQQLFKGGQFAIRWGFIPVVLYLGFKRGADPGMPEPTILSVLESSSPITACSKTTELEEEAKEKQRRFGQSSYESVCQRE